jgi:hypothetical protein
LKRQERQQHRSTDSDICQQLLVVAGSGKNTPEEEIGWNKFPHFSIIVPGFINGSNLHNAK